MGDSHSHLRPNPIQHLSSNATMPTDAYCVLCWGMVRNASLLLFVPLPWGLIPAALTGAAKLDGTGSSLKILCHHEYQWRQIRHLYDGNCFPFYSPHYATLSSLSCLYIVGFNWSDQYTPEWSVQTQNVFLFPYKARCSLPYQGKTKQNSHAEEGVPGSINAPGKSLLHGSS